MDIGMDYIGGMDAMGRGIRTEHGDADKCVRPGVPGLERRRGPHGRGSRDIAGVTVSDGIQVTQTDASGRYRLNGVSSGSAGCLFMVVPTGHRAAMKFYCPLDDTAGTITNDFGLIHWEKSDRTNFSFIHVTDLHIGNAQCRDELVEDFKEIEPLDPAFIVATGDLVETGWRNPNQFGFYREALEKTTLRVMNGPGNHDVGHSEIYNNEMPYAL